MNFKNLKIKKIIGTILIGTLTLNIGFSPNLVYETESNNPTINSEITEVKNAIYSVNRNNQNNNYQVISYSASELIDLPNIDGYYTDFEQAKLGANYGITDKNDFGEVIKVEIQDNPQATDEQRNSIIKYGYEPYSVDGYTILSSSAGNAQNKVDDLNNKISTTEGNTPENKRLLTVAEKELNDLENQLNKYPPSIDQQGQILAKLPENDRSKLLEAINEEECGDSWIPFCETILGSNAEQAIESSFIENINPNEPDTDKYNKDLTKNLISHTDVGLTCEGSETCDMEYLSNQLNDKIEHYNENIEKCGGVETCENAFSDQDEKLTEAKKLLAKAKGYEKVETGWLYAGIDLIRNQDPQAKASARFFGFGADYSDLPNWLQEQGLAASQICIGSIDGYLDDDSNTGGTSVNDDSRLVKYGYNSTTSKLDVIYDLRAYRTRVTPDNMTSITVSVYLKAPKDDSLTYQLGLSYKNGNRIEKELLLGKTNVSAGETVGDMFPFDVEVKGGRKVLENSFFLYLKAKTNSGVVVADASTNIYTIYTGTENSFEVDGVSVSGNNQGNVGDNTNKDSEQATDSFWFN